MARPVGRPPHVPNDVTRGQVRILAVLGLEETTISQHLELSRPTLRKHYRKDLKTARTQIAMNAMAVVMQAMTDTRNDLRDRVGAAMWILRAVARMDGRAGADVNLNVNLGEKPSDEKVVNPRTIDANEAARKYLDLMTGENSKQLRVIKGGKK